MLEGQCHCGAIRYRTEGAPMVGWAMFKSGQVEVTEGEPKVYASSDHGRRHFCGACGTGLFYTNDEVLPGITDVQSGTLDDPGALPAQVQIQVADRISWMKEAHALPQFERYPG